MTKILPVIPDMARFAEMELVKLRRALGVPDPIDDCMADLRETPEAPLQPGKKPSKKD